MAADSDPTEVLRIKPTRADLVVAEGPAEVRGRRFRIAGADVWIGRHADCDLALPDARVSRLHAVIAVQPDALVLVHRSQTNATLLNGVPVDEPAPLADGDEILLAEEIRLRLEAPGLRRGSAPRGSMRHAMEARLQLEARIERDFLRSGCFFNLDVADSLGLSADDARPDHVVLSFERFRAFALSLVERHGGRLLNWNGDEVMAFFAEADGAVEAARAILTELPGWNSRHNLLGKPFRVRLGIHVGRAAIDLASGVAYGAAVSRAGHLQKAAPLDGLRISDDAYRSLSASRMAFRSAGPLPREGVPTYALAD
jgi:class 3 adenylate cyclase